MGSSRCSDYDVYSKFDVGKHKEHFVHYLEVMISPDGEIEYAVPSHQEYAIKKACEALGVTRMELSDMTPPEYYFDWLNWLLAQTGYMAVWEDGYVCPNPTKKQIGKLKMLKLNGLYRGAISYGQTIRN